MRDINVVLGQSDYKLEVRRDLTSLNRVGRKDLSEEVTFDLHLKAEKPAPLGKI